MRDDRIGTDDRAKTSILPGCPTEMTGTPLANTSVRAFAISVGLGFWGFVSGYSELFLIHGGYK